MKHKLINICLREHLWWGLVWLKLSYNHTGSIQFSIQVATKLVNYYDPYQVQALIGKLALQAQVGKDP